MMYSEFLEKTQFTEKFITFTMYTNYIEPIYTYSSLATKDIFCKEFRKLYDKNIFTVSEFLLKCKSTNNKIEYLNGNNEIVKDIDDVINNVLLIFLQGLHNFKELQ